MNTMNMMTATAITKRPMINNGLRAPVRPSSKVPAKALGSSATMPAKMISEIPLPTPRAVICSPSHIRKMVPPTRVTTAVKRKNMPGSMTAEPCEPCMDSRPTEMP